MNAILLPHCNRDNWCSLSRLCISFGPQLEHKQPGPYLIQPIDELQSQSNKVGSLELSGRRLYL